VLAGATSRALETGVHVALFTAGVMLLGAASADAAAGVTVWFLSRMAVVLIVFAGIYAVAEALASQEVRWRALERLGRSSLFVYWVHVELVYGHLTRPVHDRLPFWVMLGACAAFTGLMYRLTFVRDRLVERWSEAQAQRRPSGVLGWTDRAYALASESVKERRRSAGTPC
jgi:hypothetical protein